MKKYTSYIVTCALSLIVGFLITFFMMAKNLSKEVEQVIIMQKLILIDQIADDIRENLNDRQESDKSTLAIICEQLPYLNREAVDAGKPVSDLIDHIRYSNLVIEKFKLLSADIGDSGCQL